MIDWASDSRVVLTLDAGGTSFRFAAICGGTPVGKGVAIPSAPGDLKECLSRIVEGFRRVKGSCPDPPVAISFAFPGPADYPRGIIGDLGNLPCFRGGVPLGPMLEDEFEVPVFINNDGDLFAYGEAIGGLLPHVNRMLEQGGSPKRFHNLLGVTLGTGFGGGIVRNGEIFIGDNSIAGEIWLLRNKLFPAMNVEENVSIRAVRRVYVDLTGTAFEQAPQPDEICRIAAEGLPGGGAAARESFRRLGEAAGDAIAQAATLLDGLVVVGGGLSGAAPFFLPALVDEMNGEYAQPDRENIRRLAARAFNLEDPEQLNGFLAGAVRHIKVLDLVNAAPRPARVVTHDAMPRVGVGLTRLGTSGAVALGAYAFALQNLEPK